MRWLQFSDPLLGFYLKPDDNDSGGDNKEKEDKEKDGNTSDVDGKNTDADKDDEVKFDEKQQAKVNKLIADAKKKAADKVKADSEAATKKAAEEAEAENLKKQGEFQKLYEGANKAKEDAEATVASLKEKLDSLHERQNKSITETIKSWDKDLKVSDPGPDNIDARITWFEMMSPIATKLAAKGTTTVPNTEGGDGDNNGKPKADQVVRDITKNTDWVPGQ
jgi:hypothetical protein